MSGDLDPDGLPLFPPLPEGRAVRAQAGSLIRLVNLRTAVLTVRTEALAAMVVLLDREPIDGLAIRGDRRVVGPEALDEIEDVPLDQVTVTEVAPELARELGSYYLPSELGELPASVVVAEDFVRSLARPGRRGCVVVRAGRTLGLAFLAGGRIAVAYRQGEVAGGLEQLAPLLADPGACLWARLGPDHREPVPTTEAPPPPAAVARWLEPVTTPEPIAAPEPSAAPEAAAVPEAFDEPDDFELPGDFLLPEPPPAREIIVPPEPPTAGEAPASPAPVVRSAKTPLEAVLEEVRAVVGPHAARVESVLSRADPSVEGLKAAVESLRARRLRLFSPATMELIADRAVEALERHAASRT